eukprot:SAG22_NODE_420_length_10739_cov_7.090320_3_plen_63_part_00
MREIQQRVALIQFGHGVGHIRMTMQLLVLRSMRRMPVVQRPRRFSSTEGWPAGLVIGTLLSQ